MEQIHKINKVILVIALFGLLSACYPQKEITENSVPTQENAPEKLYPAADKVVPYMTEWTKKHYPSRIKHFRNNPLMYRDIVFLGNSITESGGDWAKRFNKANIKNRGIGGDVTEGVLNRLGEICYYKPTSVFLLIGTNDFANGDKSARFVSDNIIKIANEIHDKSPGTKIYVQTILPTKHEYKIARIKEANSILKKKESKHPYILINLYDLLADDNKYMIRDEYTNDGTHLTEAAYQVWVDAVKGFID